MKPIFDTDQNMRPSHCHGDLIQLYVLRDTALPSDFLSRTHLKSKMESGKVETMRSCKAGPVVLEYIR